MIKHGTVLKPLEIRFWSKVKKTRGCWYWTGMTHTGYGAIWVGRPLRYAVASRISWTLAHGEIPCGLCVLHHCDNRVCVRPSHLFLGDRADNIRDQYEKYGTTNQAAVDKRAEKMRAMTVCKRGHSWLKPHNVTVDQWGWRHCLACKREAYRARQRGN